MTTLGSEAITQPVPITVIAGYLGAGKTTLINDALRRLDDASGLALLVNDFGELNIDAALLRGAIEDERILSLQNGCICCALQDDLAQSLEALRGRGIERIWMEASGVALPGKTKRACAYPGYFPAQALVVVDGGQFENLRRDKYVGRLVLQQVEEADVVMLSKYRIDERRIQDVLQDDQRLIWCEDPCVYSVLANPTSIERALATGVARTEFETMKLEGDRWRNEAELRQFLTDLPASAYRVKGYVALGGKYYLVQKVGDNIEITRADAPELGLIVIYPKGPN